MANTKISALTALTGANLATGDQFAVVDTSAAATKSITVAELKLGIMPAPGPIGATTPSTGAFTTLSATTGAAVGGATPGAGGLAFPATAVAVADANTLDDYEEGTWTPTLTFGTPGDLNVVYSLRNGYYTKVGRLVTLRVEIITSTFTYTTASGAMSITGLPFTVSSSGTMYDIGACVYQGYVDAARPNLVAVAVASTAALGLRGGGSGVAVANASTTQFLTASNPSILATITYFI